VLVDQLEVADAGVVVVAQLQAMAIREVVPLLFARRTGHQAVLRDDQQPLPEMQARIEVNLNGT
jgi:hypothetical protein